MPASRLARAQNALTRLQRYHEQRGDIACAQGCRDGQALLLNPKACLTRVTILCALGDFLADPSALEPPTALGEREKALALFQTIHGVGPATAQKWVDQGLRSLGELAQRSLTRKQRLGLDHHHDFAERISVAEFELHRVSLSAALHRIDPNITMDIVGSFRRGALSLKDMDVVVSSSICSISTLRRKVFFDLFNHLRESGYLRGTLSGGSAVNGVLWHGAVALEGRPWRRMDIFLVPHEIRGAAQLHYTGSAYFNRGMEEHARQQGMVVGPWGLRRLGPQGWENLPCEREETVFERLGLTWIPPAQRSL